MHSIPKDIRLLSWATAIRWIGWGVFEAFIPVFLFAFANSYAETGLLSSIYNVVFLFMLPFVGLLADRVAAKSIILIGLIIYPFIGLSYFLAGATGIVLFVVIARALNGVSYAFYGIGSATYIMCHSPKN
ncbi:hypothetical protein COV18_06565 [Candidatus Woesearchaeota archaeon CG10_big_fil_rev_8_21_14_0_10_37_12]|nr:MAG: hypothetical protein COV18_06565 [Candidatus Woesearchaeota archaeon CG10_big_fil_rev_8_21_14_0_10_37_12]